MYIKPWIHNMYIMHTQGIYMMMFNIHMLSRHVSPYSCDLMMSQLLITVTQSLFVSELFSVFVHPSVNSGRGIDRVIRWGTVTTWTCCLGCLRTAWSTVSRRRTQGTRVVLFDDGCIITLFLCGCFRWRGPEQHGRHPRDGHPWAAEGSHGARAEQ